MKWYQMKKAFQNKDWLTLYPYLAMILAATPNPGALEPAGTKAGAKDVSAGGPELSSGFVVSVREGGGAMAAPPPEVAVQESKAN